MSLDYSFGRWLQQRRKAVGLTQAGLANQVGCATVTIHKVEIEERRPSKEIAERLAECLHIAEEERAAFLRFARGETAAIRPTPLPPQAVPVPEHPPTRSPVPVPLTPVLGREREIAAVSEVLRCSTVRLVTLTGPGGVGKTRLALAVAAEVHDAFVDGVVFVPLAAISDPALVLPTVAQALELRETGNQPLLESLTAALQAKQILLVVDNLEQVVDAAPDLVALLLAAPHLTLLVTSRVVLHYSGEHVFVVPPLRLPKPDHLPPLECLTQYAAVALFLQRAQAVKPDFQLTSDTAPTVAEICARLDGLPLAIELAAARVRLLSPPTLLARLRNRLTLLTGGPRDLAMRQQTLRDTIDWSYQLLDADEQRLVARLAVFVGGCTLEAAEAVGNVDGGLPLDVLDGLQSLLDKNLLYQQDGVAGEVRFSMLETIREYALERLEASGDAPVLQRRHATYYVALAEAAEAELRGAEQQVWLTRLEVEQDNLRAALQWALAGKDPPLGLRLAGALWLYWVRRGYLSEGTRWLQAALEQGREPAPARAKGLLGAGVLAWLQGEHARSTACYSESLAAYREVGDQGGAATALRLWGRTVRAQGDAYRAGTLAKESLALFRTLGDTEGSAWALLLLGQVALDHGALAEATARCKEAVSLFQVLGDTEGTAWALLNLGRVEYWQGDYGQATARYQESLALFEELGNSGGSAEVLLELGRVAHAQGDAPQARRLYQAALARNREGSDKLWMTKYLAAVAAVAGATGQREQAARLFGAAEALREAIDMPLPPVARAEYAHSVAAARTHVDAARWADAWAAGRAMSWEQAIAAALDR